MITILSGLFIKNRDQFGDSDVRRAYGMLCSIVGIALNVFLFAGKYLAGVISGSIAITADAFNNLSDAGSSFISMIGFKFSGMKADADHPFGHGRIEYVAGFGVSMIIILMGFELLKTSVGKIVHPEPVEASVLAAGILITSICDESDGNGQHERQYRDYSGSDLHAGRTCDGSQRGWLVRSSGGMFCTVCRIQCRKGYPEPASWGGSVEGVRRGDSLDRPGSS